MNLTIHVFSPVVNKSLFALQASSGPLQKLQTSEVVYSQRSCWLCWCKGADPQWDVTLVCWRNTESQSTIYEGCRIDPKLHLTLLVKTD